MKYHIGDLVVFGYPHPSSKDWSIGIISKVRIGCFFVKFTYPDRYAILDEFCYNNDIEENKNVKIFPVKKVK